MERRFVTIKRSSNIDQRSLARRLAEIRELRRLVRQAEAKRRLESRETRLARRHSFEAWEKDNLATQTSTALSAALDRASANDGELLSDTDTSVLTYNEEQSLRAPVDITHMRYFEISLYRVRPGHRAQWNELVKLVKGAYEKIPNTHWAMYEAMFGQEDVTYVVFIPRKSVAEIDQDMMNEKQFVEAMGEDGMKKLVELESAAVEFTQTNLFQFNPAMSYPPDEWVKADPEFWKAHTPKPAAKAEKPAAKP